MRFLLCFLGLSFFVLPARGTSSVAPVPKAAIMMIQWRGETNAEKGFKDELKNLNFDTEFILFNTDQDKEKLLNYLHSDFIQMTNRIDYIYTFGTTASEAVKRYLPNIQSKKIVQIINIVADPVAAKLADSLSGAGENRIVGCHMVPLATQLQNALKITKLQKIGFIFNPREENSNIQLQQMTRIAGKMGFTVVPLRIKPEKDELEGAIKQIEEKKVDVDSVYLVSESFLISNAEWVVKRLNAARIPTIAAVEQYMREGALMGTIASYYRLGQLVARAVVKDFKSHHAEDNIPVIFDPNPEFVVNTSTANNLNLKINDKPLPGVKYVK